MHRRIFSYSKTIQIRTNQPNEKRREKRGEMKNYRYMYNCTRQFVIFDVIRLWVVSFLFKLSMNLFKTARLSRFSIRLYICLWVSFFGFAPFAHSTFISCIFGVPKYIYHLMPPKYQTVRQCEAITVIWIS